jgi:hypothetical protein
LNLACFFKLYGVVLPVASAKLLLIPLAIVAGLLFVLLVGALALGIALGLISLLSWLVRASARLVTRQPNA